jgi:hypothetical protein
MSNFALPPANNLCFPQETQIQKVLQQLLQHQPDAVVHPFMDIENQDNCFPTFTNIR